MYLHMSVSLFAGVYLVPLLITSCRIAERRDAVIARRQNLKTVSTARAKKLQDSLAWQNFRRDGNEVIHEVCYLHYTCTRILVHVLLTLDC